MIPLPLFILLLLIAIGLGVALWLVYSRWQRDLTNQREERANWQRNLEDHVQQAREERNRMLDALTDAFLLVEPDGHIRFANEAANQLFHSRTLIDRTIRAAFTDPRLAQAINDGLHSGDARQTRITLPQQASPRGELEKRGINSWIIDVAPLPKSPTHPDLSRVIIRDMTAEHQTEQIRKDFVANASHELRTPMAIIHGYLENLLDDDMLEDEELSRKFLTIMRKHSDRISRIVEDMLVISRLESGEEGSLKVEPFLLADCLQDNLDRLESLIRNQQAKVELQLEPKDVKLEGDRFYWTQALFNLIENALKQNPRPGLKIQVGCRIEGDQLEIWVRDNGIGIPSSDLPFIFRRFYRVDKQHSQSEIKGTGLGLSIVKRAIEAHQGSIEATSTPGTETRFSIRVPLAGPKSRQVPLEASLTSGEPG